MQYALENWPTSDASYRKDGKTGAYHYKQSVYDELEFNNIMHKEA